MARGCLSSPVVPWPPPAVRQTLRSTSSQTRTTQLCWHMASGQANRGSGGGERAGHGYNDACKKKCRQGVRTLLLYSQEASRRPSPRNIVSCSENAARAEDVQTTSGITGAKAQLIPYSPLWDHESSECRGDLVEKERYTSRQHRLPAHHGQVKK